MSGQASKLVDSVEAFSDFRGKAKSGWVSCMSFLAGYEHIVRENEPLAAYTTLGLGGPARYFIEPSSEKELIGIVQACHKARVAMRVIGGGSNLIIRSGGFDGAVISIASPVFTSMSTDGAMVRCGGGARLSHLISFCIGAKLGGIEHLVGIPGTIGGALHGNAGTLNGDIGSLVHSARLLASDGTVTEVVRSQMHFGTRQSSLDELLILDVELKLQFGDPTALTKRMQTMWIVKRAGQPSQFSRTALAFVDPDLGSAAKLISECSLAGHREGTAQICPAYPNYIVVDGKADANDVLRLLDVVRRTVEEKRGVQLQLHPRIW